MAHAQKPDFVFRRNGRVHLNLQGCQFSRLLAAEVCASAVVMLDTPCSEIGKGTDYPLHSPVSPSPPLPCVTVCHHISTGLYAPFTGKELQTRRKYLKMNALCVLQAYATAWRRSSLFWHVAQCISEVIYWRFGTTYRQYLKGPGSPKHR